jgi:hypothetical protein
MNLGCRSSCVRRGKARGLGSSEGCCLTIHCWVLFKISPLLACHGKRDYADFIVRSDMKAIAVLSARSSRATIVMVLCVCVLSQMLGMPVTLVGLLASSDLLTETVSEDFSLTPIVPEPGILGSSRIGVEFQPSRHLPVYVNSVFHPPQT